MKNNRTYDVPKGTRVYLYNGDIMVGNATTKKHVTYTDADIVGYWPATPAFQSYYEFKLPKPIEFKNRYDRTITVVSIGVFYNNMVETGEGPTLTKMSPPRASKKSSVIASNNDILRVVTRVGKQ